MEDNQILDNAFSPGDNLTISTSSMAYLREIGKWAKFFAILGFIGIGFMVLGGLFFGTFMGRLGGGAMGAGMVGMAPGIMGAIYVIFAVIMVVPMIYLNKFANYISVAINSNDNHSLEMAFEKFKSYYKYIGIFTIVILGIYALIFVFAIFAGLASAF